jgi:hypothetical protein
VPRLRKPAITLHRITPATTGVIVPRTRKESDPVRTSVTIPPFVDGALCAQVDPEVFFPEKGGSFRDAKRICAMCPVRQECLDWALENREPFGIWGGKSVSERQKIRAANSRSAAA